MADPLTSALIGTIVTNLSSEALKQYALLAGLNTELEKLSTTFTTVQAVLCDAERKQWSSGSEGEAVKTWLRQLKDAAYDADDVLDEFDVEVQRRQQQRGLKNHARSFFSLHHNSIAFRVEIAGKLKSVRERLDAIYVNRPPGLNAGSISSVQDVLEWRLTTSLVDDSEIRGRVDEKAELINDLILSSEPLSVHALCGVGGIGKTTLAQLVYNDEKVGTHFPLRMWVCVSDDTDIKRLTRAIIGGCGNSDEKEELESLQQRLREKLGGQRFLLVLDDVWDDFPDKWDRSKNAIKCGALGSVVLITTRIQRVAEKMRTVSIRHTGRLSDDDSWSLFALHAFRNGRSQEPFEKFQKGIVKKCGGVPLVLNILGSLMQEKREEYEWLAVMASELWNLPDEGEKILATLKLSYTHLPMNLRQCFSYCCIFPKDYVMKKEELIQLWMANDFISWGGRNGLHERGQEIFSQLVGRSFLQNVEIDCWGDITCKMHDLLHDVATSVVEDEIHIIQPGESFDDAKKCRHVSISYDELEEYGIKGNSKISSLRSLIVTKEEDWYRYGEYIKNVEWLSTKKYLRILRCEKLPMSLSKHLRYLDLSGSFIERLPNSTCSLYKLQTLDLKSCLFLQQLPKGMKEMKSLVYLDIRSCYELKGMPPGMGQLKGLRKLSKFVVGEKDGCRIGELKELNSLEGELSISCLYNIKTAAEAESANLMGKKMLTSLELIAGTRPDLLLKKDGNVIDMEVLSRLQPHENLRKLVINGYGSLGLPNWMMDLHMHLPHLVEIKLRKFLKCEQLQIPLGRLNSLKELELHGMPCLQYIGVEVYGDGERAAFPSLEKLTLNRMSSLKEWTEISSSTKAALPFPRLPHLTIRKCPMLTKFPMIPSLQDLSIKGTTAAAPQVWVLIKSNFIGLKSLSVIKRNELESFPELDLRHNVCSLEKLEISWCSILQSLPSSPGLWCSSSLRYLKIVSCLEFITLSEDGLPHLTALESLHLINCPKMTSLPESIQHLTSLQTLEIFECAGLSYLPDGIRRLTTLAALEIGNCRGLERRCEKEKGEDWPNDRSHPFYSHQTVAGYVHQLMKEVAWRETLLGFRSSLSNNANRRSEFDGAFESAVRSYQQNFHLFEHGDEEPFDGPGGFFSCTVFDPP